MLPYQLVEIAALVAGQGPVLLKAAPRLSESGLEQYWVASKCRLDRWGRALKQQTAVSQKPRPRRERSIAAQPLATEILASEVLTRVWTALGCAVDDVHCSRDVGPIVRGIYVGHLEARNRVLNLMLHGQGMGVEGAVVLNRLRHRLERWTDMLLAYLHPSADAREFAFEPPRMLEFAEDIQFEQRQAPGEIIWQIVVASLRAAFAPGLICEPRNADLHERIVAGVLSCFESEVFDSTGVFKSLWLMRMTNVANDTQGLIDSLLADERPPPPQPDAQPKKRF
jgi:hypothetical protein